MKNLVSICLSIALLVMPILKVGAQETDNYSKPKRHNAGKVISMTGAGLVLGGSAMMLKDLNSSHYSNGGTYIAGALTAAFGAALALIGVPMWVVGNDKSQYADFSGECQKGFSAIIGLEAMNSAFMNADFSGGYHFNENFFLGVGLSTQKFLVGKEFCLPVFIDARYAIGDTKYAPYIGAQLGYEPIRKGAYTELNLGTRIRVGGGSGKDSWWIGANVIYHGSDNLLSSGINVLYSF